MRKWLLQSSQRGREDPGGGSGTLADLDLQRDLGRNQLPLA